MFDLSLPESDLRSQLEALDDRQLLFLEWQTSWRSSARVEQLPPDGDWSTWLILSGRGWGKSRTGAEWIADEAWRDPGSISFVIAPTFNDLKFVCFDGPSGLLSFLPSALVSNYNKTDSVLTMTNGSIIRGFSATEPNRLRGPQSHRVWCDELATWPYLRDTWDMMQFGLRLGTNTRTVVTTTPRPLKFLRDLAKESGTHLTTGSTYENRANLAASFFKKITSYEGTELGRQEIHGEVLNYEDSGIIKRSWLKLWPNSKPFPTLFFVLQSYDTAFKMRVANDYTACTTWGVFRPDDRGPLALMLLDCWKDKLEYPELRDKVQKEYAYVYGEDDKTVDVVLIEDKGSGQSLLQDLARAGVPSSPYNPKNEDKILRLNTVSHLVMDGLVWIPESKLRAGEPRNWVIPFLEELCTFSIQTFDTQPDDYVDSFAQAIAFIRDSSWLVSKRDPLDPEPEEQKQVVNPYGV